MKARARLLERVALFALALSVLVSAPIAAQQLSPTVIAIVDYEKIRRDSLAFRDIREQLKQRSQLYQEEINKQEQGLRIANQEITRQQTILAPDAFDQKRREFETQVSQVQLSAQTRKRELDEAQDRSYREVGTALRDVIAELSRERGFNVVLGRNQVMYADKSINISDEVLARLNQRLPTVRVPEAGN